MSNLPENLPAPQGPQEVKAFDLQKLIRQMRESGISAYPDRDEPVSKEDFIRYMKSDDVSRKDSSEDNDSDESWDKGPSDKSVRSLDKKLDSEDYSEDESDVSDEEISVGSYSDVEDHKKMTEEQLERGAVQGLCKLAQSKTPESSSDSAQISLKMAAMERIERESKLLTSMSKTQEQALKGQLTEQQETIASLMKKNNKLESELKDANEQIEWLDEQIANLEGENTMKEVFEKQSKDFESLKSTILENQKTFNFGKTMSEKYWALVEEEKKWILEIQNLMSMVEQMKEEGVEKDRKINVLMGRILPGDTGLMVQEEGLQKGSEMEKETPNSLDELNVDLVAAKNRMVDLERELEIMRNEDQDRDEEFSELCSKVEFLKKENDVLRKTATRKIYDLKKELDDQMLMVELMKEEGVEKDRKITELMMRNPPGLRLPESKVQKEGLRKGSEIGKETPNALEELNVELVAKNQRIKELEDQMSMVKQMKEEGVETDRKIKELMMKNPPGLRLPEFKVQEEGLQKGSEMGKEIPKDLLEMKEKVIRLGKLHSQLKGHLREKQSDYYIKTSEFLQHVEHLQKLKDACDKLNAPKESNTYLMALKLVQSFYRQIVDLDKELKDQKKHHEQETQEWKDEIRGYRSMNQKRAEQIQQMKSQIEYHKLGNLSILDNTKDSRIQAQQREIENLQKAKDSLTSRLAQEEIDHRNELEYKRGVIWNLEQMLEATRCDDPENARLKVHEKVKEELENRCEMKEDMIKLLENEAEEWENKERHMKRQILELAQNYEKAKKEIQNLNSKLAEESENRHDLQSRLQKQKENNLGQQRTIEQLRADLDNRNRHVYSNQESGHGYSNQEHGRGHSNQESGRGQVRHFFGRQVPSDHHHHDYSNQESDSSYRTQQNGHRHGDRSQESGRGQMRYTNGRQPSSHHDYSNQRPLDYSNRHQDYSNQRPLTRDSGRGPESSSYHNDRQNGSYSNRHYVHVRDARGFGIYRNQENGNGGREQF